MKKNIVFVILTFVLLFACASTPPNFTYKYTDTYTGLDTLININGYYVAEHGCDSTFYSIFMFYPDGLFTIATTSEITPELVQCFTQGGKTTLCKYPLWGTYVVDEDLIRTQVIRSEAGGFVIFRDYRILGNGQIENISDYLETEYINLGYLENYPSLKENECVKSAIFYPTTTKRPISDCPILEHKVL